MRKALKMTLLVMMSFSMLVGCGKSMNKAAGLLDAAKEKAVEAQERKKETEAPAEEKVSLKNKNSEGREKAETAGAGTEARGEADKKALAGYYISTEGAHNEIELTESNGIIAAAIFVDDAQTAYSFMYAGDISYGKEIVVDANVDNGTQERRITPIEVTFNEDSIVVDRMDEGNPIIFAKAETAADYDYASGNTVSGAVGAPDGAANNQYSAAASEPPTFNLGYAYERYVDRSRRIWISRDMVSASSSIYQKGYDNSGYRAFDGDVTTSWQVDTRRTGIGEYVDVYFGREQSIRQMTLVLGNHRDYDWFVKNHVPRILSFQFDGASYYGVVFPKTMDEFVIEFSQPVVTRSVRITIDDIYPGSKYDDTVVADIGFYY